MAEQLRLQYLSEKYPDLRSIRREIETNIENDKTGSFVLYVSDNPEKREFAHIVARQHGWHSRKIMSDIEYGTRQGRCSRCHWIASADYVRNYDPELYCCNLDDGICVNLCQHKYDDVHNVSYGKAWVGEMEFSKIPIKVGRKTRRNRNRKRKKIMFEYLGAKNKRYCSECGKLDPRNRCVVCKTAHYCDKDCQLKNWPIHKKTCKSPT